MVDVEHTPKLKEVVVEGEIMFDNLKTNCTLDPRTFDAHWLFIKGGKLTIGFDDKPYPCPLLITMWGKRYDPEVPLYGNKVIGLRYGTIDIHGIPRNPTWIDMESTANVGAKTITLSGPVDWKINEQIVIATTSYDQDESEIRTITKIDRKNPNKPVITLCKALKYKHFSGVQTLPCGTQVEMRAEVGLLERNIVIQGDPSSDADENGAIIVAKSIGDDSSIVRIENVRFQRMGQAYKVGRYPINIAVEGSVAQSYIYGNVFLRSYNRAIAMTSAQELEIRKNVIYDVSGHAIF